MKVNQLPATAQNALEAVLGYLNFSAGATDLQFLQNLNEIYRCVADRAALAAKSSETSPAWQALPQLLNEKLAALEKTSETFRSADQAREVIRLVHDEVLPAYRQHHSDLLFHQSNASLLNAFFIGRVYEAVLRCRAKTGAGDDSSVPGSDAENLVSAAVSQLNDYIGHRPVATLETEQKIEPYAHERCRPVPVHLRGVGAAVGPYESLVLRTIEILEETEPALLRQADFDLARMEEIAIDPRAYDFDHPVNKRPNYQFGGWDPHCIDNRGFYSRYVIQQVTIDALMSRLARPGEVPSEELQFEAAAALAGTILMGSGVSGSGPDSHGSNVSLNTLLPQIAAYRDAFYESLLEQHGESVPRLVREAARQRQPFGGVRQHLNAELGRIRASQLEHLHLAKVYARMGYCESARQQAATTGTASARIVCEIHCLLNEAHMAMDKADLASAAEKTPKTIELLHRGIQCGAIIDPWNILGFDAQFSLFPALENSVYDHRVDDLMELMDRIFALLGRALTLASAAGDLSIRQNLSQCFAELAQWWDQFAVVVVSNVDGVAAGPLQEAAVSSAAALEAWHQVGTTAGDVAFWQPHVEDFHSPKAYVLVLGALLDRGDFVASMGVLMHWLSRADQVELQEGSDLFHAIAIRWLDDLLAPVRARATSTKPVNIDGPTASGSPDDGKLSIAERWQLVRRFFDFLEANADEYWQVPELELDSLLGPSEEIDEEEEDEEDEDDELYSAAYDGVTFRDSSDDGVESSLMGDALSASDFELEHEARRISDRLVFLITMARLWKHAAQVMSVTEPEAGQEGEVPYDRLSIWLNQVLINRAGLLELLDSIARHQVPRPSGTMDSRVEFDRRRMIQESLLERISAAVIASTEAAIFLLAAGAERRGDAPELDGDVNALAAVLRAALDGDADGVVAALKPLYEAMEGQPLLYVPLSRGGDARRMAAVRARQRGVRLLLGLLPRLGLLIETRELLAKCAEVERDVPAGSGAVTEFDHLFRAGMQAMVACLAEATDRPAGVEQTAAEGQDEADHELVEHLQFLAERMMECWLDHSRTLRLSVLEKVAESKRWKRLVEFTQRFGHELFTQPFFHLGNLRAILHHGVDAWLDDLEESPETEDLPIVQARHEPDAQKKVLEPLRLTIEAIVENYAEYRDYNGTTTQSDRGELLYTLLDMLRLRVDYDRVAWNLSPVVWAHEVLVRMRRTAAGEIWRRELMERTQQLSDDLLARLKKVETKYGMRLSTVADRLGERFVRPLQIDRIRSLVRPAVDEAARECLAGSFDELARQVADLTRQPTGGGLDVPAWLEALEDEVERARAPAYQRELEDELPMLVRQRRVSLDALQQQLEAL